MRRMINDQNAWSGSSYGKCVALNTAGVVATQTDVFRSGSLEGAEPQFPGPIHCGNVAPDFGHGTPEYNPKPIVSVSGTCRRISATSPYAIIVSTLVES